MELLTGVILRIPCCKLLISRADPSGAEVFPKLDAQIHGALALFIAHHALP